MELGEWLPLDLTTPPPEKEEEDGFMDMEEPPPPPGLEIECSIPEAIFSEEEAAVTNSLTLTMVRSKRLPYTPSHKTHARTHAAADGAGGALMNDVGCLGRVTCTVFPRHFSLPRTAR